MWRLLLITALFLVSVVSAEPDPARAVRILRALDARLGREKAVAFLDSACLLTLAGSRGLATWGPPFRLKMQAADLAPADAVLQAEGLLLEREDTNNGFILNLHCADGYRYALERSRLPGLVPFPDKLSKATLERWETTTKESLKSADYPAVYRPEHILYGLQYGFPDRALLDWQEMKYVAKSKGLPHPEIASPVIPFGTAFGQKSVGFIVLKEHATYPEIESVTREWGDILKRIADDPWVRSLLQDPVVLVTLGVLVYPPENTTSHWGLMARQGLWSFDADFETARVGTGPIPYKEPSAATALAVLEGVAGVSHAYAAMLSEAEPMLAMVGHRSLARVTLPDPRPQDLRDLDAVNSVLLRHGMSLRPLLDFAQSGMLVLHNPVAVQTVFTEARSDDPSFTRIYDTAKGWPGYRDLTVREYNKREFEIYDAVLEGIPVRAVADSREQRVQLRHPVYDVEIGVGVQHVNDPGVRRWMTRVEDTLEGCYGGAEWRELLNNRGLAAARVERLGKLAAFGKKRADEMKRWREKTK